MTIVGLEPAAAQPLAPRRGGARRALTRGQGALGLTIVVAIVAVGIFAPLLAPYDPLAQIPGANLVGPSWSHWFGTDEINRDILSRVLFGIRVDVVVAAVAVPIGATIGGLIGLIATSHPAADVVAARAFDVILAFPTLILAITLAAVVGPGTSTIVIVIVATEIPIFGRLIRTAVLTVREQPFVEATAVIGAGRWWILRTHVLPNAVEAAGVQLALSLSLAVFVESAMSFIGIGVRPPAPSLGSLIAESVADLDANPMFAVGPLIVVALLVLGLLLIAQALGRERRS